MTMALGDALASICAMERGFKEIDFARFHPSGSLHKLNFETVENIMKHTVFKVVTSGTEFHRLRRKLQYSQADVLSNNLAIVELEKASLVYDKPRYVGITVLNLAKLLMYNFHYQEVKRRFGKVKAQVSLLFTDTDSLMYSIEQKPDQKQYNPWKILSRSKEMVFHNFPPNSKYYCEKNIMVPGCFKSEFANKLILEFGGGFVN